MSTSKEYRSGNEHRHIESPSCTVLGNSIESVVDASKLAASSQQLLSAVGLEPHGIKTKAKAC
jgi:hypothetical protein